MNILWFSIKMAGMMDGWNPTIKIASVHIHISRNSFIRVQWIV